jgi:hypothetical protein
MKKSIFIFLFLVNLSGFAKSWLVSNITPTADFTSLTLAHAQAQAGDTIFVEGSGTPYAGFTLTKKLILIGPGYFLTENPNAHYNKKPALIKSDVVFENGSAGSEIVGFDLKSYGSNIFIRNSEITILRNRLSNIYFDHQNEPETYNDCYISQNYIEGTICNKNLYQGNMLIMNNLIVSNNFIHEIGFGQSSNLIISVLFEDNVIDFNCFCCNSIFRNNVINASGDHIYGVFEKNKYNNVYNNILTCSSPSNLTNYQLGSNNQWLINQSTIFVGSTNNSTDGQWQLLANSPAKSAGSDGSDCGMFGGATPYQLSGLPPIPVVYDIIGPDLQTGKVTVKARAIK